MMDFLLNSEYLQTLLSPAEQASLTKYLIIVYVVWATMGRKVSSRFKELNEEMNKGVAKGLVMIQEHMTAIEEKFDNVTAEMRAMKDAVSKDLQVNSQRLSQVETELSTIKQQVTDLKSKRSPI